MSWLKIQNFDHAEQSGITVVMVMDRESQASCLTLRRELDEGDAKATLVTTGGERP